MKYNIISFIICLTLICCEISSPGVRFAFSQKGIQGLEAEFIPALLNNTKFPLSDLNISQHIDFLGTVNLNFTNPQLSFNITEKNIQVKFEEDATIYINLDDFNGKIDFNYIFKSGFYNNESPGYISINNIKIKTTNKLMSQPNLLEKNKLSPKIEFTQLEVESMEFDISFENFGNLEKLMKYFLDNVQGYFLNQVKSILADAVPKANDYVNLLLANLTLHTDIEGTDLTIDYTLADSPRVIEDILEMNFNASVTSRDTNTTYEGTSMPIPHNKNSSAPLDGFINQYIFDSLSYALYKQNQTNFLVNNSMISTFTLALAIPELYSYYKASKQVALNFVATDFPKINIKENLTQINLNYNSDFIVVMNETSNEVAFNADTSILLNASIFMHQNTLKAKIYDIKLETFKVATSNIGAINDKNLAQNLNGVISTFMSVLEGQITQIISQIKIPNIYGISFEDTEVNSHDGYVQFAITPHLEKKLSNSVTNSDTNSSNNDRSVDLKFLE